MEGRDRVVEVGGTTELTLPCHSMGMAILSERLPPLQLKGHGYVHIRSSKLASVCAFDCSPYKARGRVEVGIQP